MRLLARAGGITHTVELDEGNGFGFVRVKVDEREYLIDVTNPSPGLYSLVVHGKVFSAFVSPRRGARDVQIGSWSTGVEVAPAQSQRPAAKSATAVSGRQEITAPMSGRVVQVLVHNGQIVQEGESLVIIEAMKMETEIRAVARGQVKDIRVKADIAVEAGQVLLVVEGG
ncbi:MAG TPA: biotin/lipoyl-containing protein [Candidatus Tectomicrobia bacterium]|nr:biotin/lipoyl-containing protein [Candidatus Tectomicrobia bacterium]